MLANNISNVSVYKLFRKQLKVNIAVTLGELVDTNSVWRVQIWMHIISAGIQQLSYLEERGEWENRLDIADIHVDWAWIGVVYDLLKTGQVSVWQEHFIRLILNKIGWKHCWKVGTERGEHYFVTENAASTLICRWIVQADQLNIGEDFKHEQASQFGKKPAWILGIRKQLT